MGFFFEPILLVDGAGNSSEAGYYETLDPDPVLGVNYYRLQQVDFDGTRTQSATRTATIQGESQFQVYPNPMHDVLHISVKEMDVPRDLTVEIFNVLGQKVYHNRFEHDGQQPTLVIKEVAAFESGNYVLTLRTSNQMQTFQLTKAR